MPEIKTALTTSLHNAAYVLKKVAASLFGFAVNHESVALSDSEACTVMYLLSKRYNQLIQIVAPAHVFKTDLAHSVNRRPGSPLVTPLKSCNGGQNMAQLHRRNNTDRLCQKFREKSLNCTDFLHSPYRQMPPRFGICESAKKSEFLHNCKLEY